MSTSDQKALSVVHQFISNPRQPLNLDLFAQVASASSIKEQASLLWLAKQFARQSLDQAESLFLHLDQFVKCFETLHVDVLGYACDLVGTLASFKHTFRDRLITKGLIWKLLDVYDSKLVQRRLQYKALWAMAQLIYCKPRSLDLERQLMKCVPYFLISFKHPWLQQISLCALFMLSHTIHDEILVSLYNLIRLDKLFAFLDRSKYNDQIISYTLRILSNLCTSKAWIYEDLLHHGLVSHVIRMFEFPVFFKDCFSIVANLGCTSTIHQEQMWQEGLWKAAFGAILAIHNDAHAAMEGLSALVVWIQNMDRDRILQMVRIPFLTALVIAYKKAAPYSNDLDEPLSAALGYILKIDETMTTFPSDWPQEYCISRPFLKMFQDTQCDWLLN